jgi:ribosome-associated protein
LWFDVVNSPGLSQEDKARLIDRLESRIGKDGVLRVISQQTRNQTDIRGLAIERFIGLLRDTRKQAPIRKEDASQ